MLHILRQNRCAAPLQFKFSQIFPSNASLNLDEISISPNPLLLKPSLLLRSLLELRRCLASPLELLRCVASPMEVRRYVASPLKVRYCVASPLEIRSCLTSPLEVHDCIALGAVASPSELPEPSEPSLRHRSSMSPRSRPPLPRLSLDWPLRRCLSSGTLSLPRLAPPPMPRHRHSAAALPHLSAAAEPRNGAVWCCRGHNGAVWCCDVSRMVPFTFLKFRHSVVLIL